MSLPKLSYNYSQKYLVFDFETECLSLVSNKAWELGWVLSEGNRVVKSDSCKIWFPDLNMSEGAARVTRFNWEQYKNEAIEEEEAYSEFESYLWDPEIAIVGHNALAFDLPVYRIQAMRRGKWNGWRGLPERTLDTMLLSRIYNDNRKAEKDLYCAQMKEIGRPPRGSKKATLGSMAKNFNIEVDEDSTHAASYDCLLTLKVLNELIYKLEL